jgi:hypothetical protein
MPLQVTIPDEDVKNLMHYYIQQRNELQSQIAVLQDRINRVDAIINQFRMGVMASNQQNGRQIKLPAMEGYSDNWTWGKKIDFVLRQAGRPLSSRQIMERIHQLEPDIKENLLKNSVPGTVSSLVAAGALLRELNEETKEMMYITNRN